MERPSTGEKPRIGLLSLKPQVENRAHNNTAAVLPKGSPDLWEWDRIVAETKRGVSADALAQRYRCPVKAIEIILDIKMSDRKTQDLQTNGADQADLAPLACEPATAEIERNRDETAGGGLAALPPTLTDRLPMIRLAQVVSTLHRDYSAFADGMDTPALRRRLSESLAHARCVVGMIERDVSTGIERRLRSPHRYPQNALARARVEKATATDGQGAGEEPVEPLAMPSSLLPSGRPGGVQDRSTVRASFRKGGMRVTKDVEVVRTGRRGP